MPAVEYWSAEMVRALPDDGNRYETVHGELLVSPSPRIMHQVVLGRVSLMLGNHLESNGIEGLFSSSADISWSDDTLVQPDLFVTDHGELRHADSWSGVQTLYLVVEILSPSSACADRFTKRRLYQEQRISTYWIVDIDHGQVETWTPQELFPIIGRQTITWRHPAAAADRVMDLAQIFRPL